MSDSLGYWVSANVSCRDIMCKPMPGSPPPFLFFVGAMGEPGNEANKTLFASVGKTREGERERERDSNKDIQDPIQYIHRGSKSSVNPQVLGSGSCL